MQDHDGRLEPQPVLECVFPGMERQGDGHVAEEWISGAGEFYSLRVGELSAGLLSHVGEAHWFHGFILGAGCS